MPVTKHRDDQLFAAPVEFEKAATFNGPLVRSKQLFVPAHLARPGTSATGWVSADSSGLLRLPAGETAAELLFPIPGLNVGDTVTGVQLLAQIESAGNEASWDLSGYRETVAAADVAQAEIGTADTGSVTEDTYVGPQGTLQIDLGALTEAVDDESQLIAVLTATTAASTDIAVVGLLVDVTTG